MELCHCIKKYTGICLIKSCVLLLAKLFCKKPPPCYRHINHFVPIKYRENLCLTSCREQVKYSF